MTLKEQRKLLHRRRIDKLRQRRHRLAVKRRIREAKRNVRLAVEAQKQAKREEREAKRQLRLRMNATSHQGTVDGFGAVTPMDEAQLKALSFSRRYRAAYLEAAAEKKRWLAAMAKQQTPTAQPPRLINV